MTGRSAFRLGQAIGAVVVLAIVVAYAALDQILLLTADDSAGDVLIWYDDADAAPGDRLHGHVWLDGAGWIVGVDVMMWQDKIGVDDCPADCKASSVDFDFTLPADLASPRTTVDVVVETRPGPHQVSFRRALPLHSPIGSALRRVGKAGLALLAVGVQGALLFALARRALRRQRDQSPLWLIPVVAVGFFTFVPLAAHAVRLRGLWFDGVAIVVWASATYAVADRLNRRLGLQRFAAAPILVDMPASDAFRSAAVSAPIRPVEDLVTAWTAVGLVVRRSGRDLIVTAPDGQLAIVPVPRSESVGGDPLVLRASDPEIAELMVAVASDVLGELRFE